MEFPIILHYVCKRSLKRKINQRINFCQSDSLDWYTYLWSLSTIKEVPLKFRIYGGILMETARSKITSPGTFEVILRTFSIIWVPTDDTIINFVGLYNTISFQKKLWSTLAYTEKKYNIFRIYNAYRNLTKAETRQYCL